MRLQPIIQLPAAWTCVDRQFGVNLFEGRLTVEDMDRLGAEGERWYRKNPVDVVELVVVYPSQVRMTAAERSRMVELIRRWEGRRRASATVVLADGLIGAAQPSVLTGLILLARPPHPSKVYGAVDEAVSWLWPHAQAVAGPDATLDELLGGVHRLCAEFEARVERPPTDEP